MLFVATVYCILLVNPQVFCRYEQQCLENNTCMQTYAEVRSVLIMFFARDPHSSCACADSKYDVGADFIEANLEGIDDESICENYSLDEDDRNVAIYVQTSKGKPSIILNGHKYRKLYNTRHGTRWKCSAEKSCSAFLYLNDKDEVIMSSDVHNHAENDRLTKENRSTDTAVIISSRKGKDLLLFRQHTYRRQYFGSEKARWVCSNNKSCRACVFTDLKNQVISSYENHCHDPPKYYLKADHVLDAMREPIILEAD